MSRRQKTIIQNRKPLIYLILQIVFSSLFTLVIKFSQSRKVENVVIIGAVNYITAALLILPIWLFNVDTGATIEECWNAVYTGGSMGAIYFTAFFFVIYCILWVGASATTVVSVLSILMPITFAAFFWEDKPSALQIAGIVFALSALLLIGIKPASVESENDNKKNADVSEKDVKTASMPWFAPLVLLGFFLLCGLSRMAQEAFKYLSVANERPTYLLTAFTIAGIPSLIVLGYFWLAKHRKPLPTEVGFGVLLGTANVLQTHFILQALEHFAGFIVFPVTSAGAIVLTTLIATRFLNEKLSMKTYIGIVIAVLALFLLY